jgi:hypothetical protein
VQQNLFRALPIFFMSNTTDVAFYSVYRQSTTKKKNTLIFIIDAANVPRFTYRHSECTVLWLKMQGSAANYILCQSYWRCVARTTGHIFPEPI